ncbi:uncharacterized protein LOC106661020 isoform X2 [Cimex lectularius]|uniref:Uncharacterized protein n=1 Tax=Cimex lectularius TaxID=79782 RepID=A0A8I6R8C9_CIMLE|nr:uncharacterized protein LOC106661020 isoform X2 [Cimex lectularius]
MDFNNRDANQVAKFDSGWQALVNSPELITKEECVATDVSMSDFNFETVIKWFKVCIRLGDKIPDKERDLYTLNLMENMKKSTEEFFSSSQLDYSTLGKIENTFSDMFDELVYPSDLWRKFNSSEKCSGSDDERDIWNLQIVALISIILLLLIIFICVCVWCMKLCKIKKVCEKDCTYDRGRYCCIDENNCPECCEYMKKSGLKFEKTRSELGQNAGSFTTLGKKKNISLTSKSSG